MRVANRAGAALLISALVILVLVGWIYHQDTLQIRSLRNRSEHLRAIIDTAEGTLSALKDVETGHRGYLITGDPTYKEPYYDGLHVFEAQLERLSVLSRDDPDIVVLVQHFVDIGGKALGEMASTVYLNDHAGRNSAVQRVLTGAGKTYMNDARSSIADIVDRESVKLRDNNRIVNATSDRIRERVLLACAILFLMVLLGTTLLDIEARRERRLAVHLERSEKRYRDLAEHLEAQVEQRTKELQSINKELESFSYSVSHDLRAPLRAIDGFSMIVLEDYTDRLDDAGRDLLNRIRIATKKMGQLIQDLLDLSRVTSASLKRESISLSSIVSSVVETLVLNDPARRVEIKIAPDLLANADAQLMRVALDNLLANAWKFTSKKPKASIEFGHSNSRGEDVFFVRDNGAGFDPEHAARLFTPFQRLHATSDFDGTGIGLATVQRVIHRHGGRIWADAKPGEGAAFFFTL